MAKDKEHYPHQEWIGYVQPVGLVVSAPALLAAQAHVTRNIGAQHQQFLANLTEDKDGRRSVADLRLFASAVFGWEASDLVDFTPPAAVPPDLEVALVEYGEMLRPTHAFQQFVPGAVTDQPPTWQFLIQSLPVGQDFDRIAELDDRAWQATPQAKFERLLRETRIPIGLLFNHTAFRLVYAPRGETSGYLTFRVQDMAEPAGRPIFAACHMLLSVERLVTLPEKQRLPAILEGSRKYQNVVSTQLAGQVLQALFELVRGFQAADAIAKGKLLEQVLAGDPNHVYHGLLTVLMRLVFILYAEDRNLLSADSVYTNHYSLTGLFERLRSDAGRHHDTMYQRFGAWAQLLTLFRLVYDGGSHDNLRIPPRHGYLFDPERYPFLEGRNSPLDSLQNLPHVSDGVVFRVLEKLLLLDGERLSYRSLDVEQIGSVYEAIMGFSLEIATGQSIAIKAKKKQGAPTTINLETLLATKAGDRNKWLKENSDQELSGKALDGLKTAKSIEDLLAALDKKIAKDVTPSPAPKEAMVLQPSDERRRSGSHYTPRSLTQPIVRKTLEPVLQQLGERPTPDQILALKVCDPAMGSGAFLVEACRQLGDELVKAWHLHNCVPKLPPDEDELLHARRLVAQRCLYGVDKNPMAVDLAKLSLWLATLAKDHPFTFLDHSLRAGDSLVGLSREQIAGFHWAPKKQKEFERTFIQNRIQRATEARAQILSAPDDAPHELQQAKLALADDALDQVRFIGDLVISAYFAANKDKARVQKLDELYLQLVAYREAGKPELRQPLAAAVKALRTSERAIVPFHWEIEFPEVFVRQNSGFDAFVGNPPYSGVVQAGSALGETYTSLQRLLFAPARGKTDLVAYFLRRTYNLLNSVGVCGFIATNTIAQGDTRESGLAQICDERGDIFYANRRIRWPGTANVIVCAVAFGKRRVNLQHQINDKIVDHISAYLFYAGGDHDPAQLANVPAIASKGVVPYGMGFTFQDGDPDCTPVAQAKSLIEKKAINAEVIRRFVGGEDLNSDPNLEPNRFIVDFGDLDEPSARAWPDVFSIVETMVKPQRMKLTTQSGAETLKRTWWQFAFQAKELSQAKKSLQRVLVTSQTSKYRVFAFLPSDWVFDQKVVVFACQTWGFFAVMQARVHEVWSLFFGSTMKDDPVYTPSDCFESFPFPLNLDNLEAVGRAYYESRADAMIKNNEGLTKTYNRFHDPDERSPEILQLRELHAAMDRAVLDAYGVDLAALTVPPCEFLLDYEDEDDEDEDELEAPAKKGKRKKKPWRYRWPDEFRDQVLALLLELNRTRAEQEALAGHAKKKAGTRVSRAKVDDLRDDNESIGEQRLF